MSVPFSAPAVAALAASLQAQGRVHPAEVAVVLFLYLTEWVMYLWVVRTVFAEEFRRGDFWDKVFTVTIAILLGLTLLVPLIVLFAAIAPSQVSSAKVIAVLFLYFVGWVAYLWVIKKEHY
jgi:glucose dehydrogenase